MSVFACRFSLNRRDMEPPAALGAVVSGWNNPRAISLLLISYLILNNLVCDITKGQEQVKINNNNLSTHFSQDVLHQFDPNFSSINHSMLY